VSVPVTTRLGSDLLRAVQVKARRARRSRSDIVAELIRLGLDVLRYPGITFVEGPAGLRAHIAGSGLDVWEVVMVHRAHKGVEDATLRHLPQLSRRQLDTALAYYQDHRQEIDAILAEQARAPEEWGHEVAVSRPARV
jgi:uncharacterized protein (DUF433 family)